METISVKGKDYVKASSIARELGYTSDYVGQLCRSRQVDAELVGRSWYVSEDSLRKHKKSRYRSSAATSKKEIRKAVVSDNEPNYLRRVVPVEAKYEADNTDLYPAFEKPANDKAKEIKPFRGTALKDDKASRSVSLSIEKRSESHSYKRNSAPASNSGKSRTSMISASSNTAGETEKLSVIDRSRRTRRGRLSGTTWLLGGVVVVTVALAAAICLFSYETQIIASDDAVIYKYYFNYQETLDLTKSALNKPFLE